MLKHKTSVLFVNTNGKDRKTIQIPTFLLLNWKKLLITVMILFAFFISIIGFFIYEHTSNYYTNKFKEKIARANQIKNAIDIQKAKESFQSIDESMDRINQFMMERGLKPLELTYTGGPLEFEITEINEVAEFYTSNILELEEIIRTTPFGKPHFGDLTSGFGTRHNPFGGIGVEKHKGLDFRGEMGSPIKSTADGTVVFAGVKGGYGNCVILKHKNHLQTLYGHLSSISVKEGQKVKLGDEIGKLGNTGRSTGPHLHYEIIYKEEKINPITFINL